MNKIVSFFKTSSPIILILICFGLGVLAKLIEKKFSDVATVSYTHLDVYKRQILECTEHKGTGLPGTSRYITNKNKKNTPDRLEIKKFNPILKRMTVHKEIK